MKSQRQLDERKEPLRDVAFQLLSRFPTARWAPIPLRLIVGSGIPSGCKSTARRESSKTRNCPDTGTRYRKTSWPDFTTIVGMSM